jgi:hypothetical protein
MLRRCVSAALVLFVIGGFVLAGEYTALITKIDKDEAKVKVFKKGDREGVEKTFKVSKDVKVMRRKGKDTEPETSSISDVEKAIEKSKAKGVFARIETEGEGTKEMVTKITYGARKGKKKE